MTTGIFDLSQNSLNSLDALFLIAPFPAIKIGDSAFVIKLYAFSMIPSSAIDLLKGKEAKGLLLVSNLAISSGNSI